MELQKIREFVQQASDLHLSACRVNYDYSLMHPKNVESYKINLFGLASHHDLQVNKEKLVDLGHFFLNTRTLQMNLQSKIWDAHPGKFLVIGFIDEVTENVTNVLRRWETCESDDFAFFLITLKKNLVLPSFEKIVIKKGKKQLRENFSVPELPWVSLVYDSFELYKCKMECFYVPDWEKMIKKYSIVEGLLFFEETSEVLVYHNTKKRQKKIDLSGIVVLDFFDESCQDLFFNDENLGKKVKYYKIYSGIEGKNFRYSLEDKGFSHPTAEQLRIIDFPCTFVFCNQKLLWRGNKFYCSFNSLIRSYSEGSEYCESLSSERTVREAFDRLKPSFHLESFILDVKIDVLLTLTSKKTLEEKIKTKLIVSIDEEDEKSRLEALQNSLKPILPNLSVEISPRRKLFNTSIESHSFASPKPPNHLKLQKEHSSNSLLEKIQKLKKKISDQSEKIHHLETSLSKNSEIIEKQSLTIQEFRSSNLGKLHSRVDKMIEEKTRLEVELDDKAKQIRELSQRIAHLRKDLENSDTLTEKRDGQLNNLLMKIKSQDQEIAKLNAELSKKSKSLFLLQGEITELRPSKEAMNIVDRQSRFIEELKNQLKSKDKEITVLKGIMKLADTPFPESSFSSPHKLPNIGSNRSGSIKSSKIKFNSLSKSNQDYLDEEEKTRLEAIEQEKREKIEKIEKKRLKAIQKEKIRKQAEEEKEAKEAEDMEREETRSKIYQEFLIQKAEDERKAKALEEQKKAKPAGNKGKVPVKPSPKGTKKK
jgi:hypothetical protein